MEVLVLRRRVRSVIWRSALVLVFVAFALLWVASFWHWRASIADYAGDYLDQDGFRIAQMPGVGLTAELAGQVAQAAGLPFAAYDLGGTPQISPFRPSTSIFPRRWRAITIKAR